MTASDKLTEFDKAVADELQRVNHIPYYDSHEICKHFAAEVRKRLESAQEADRRDAERYRVVRDNCDFAVYRYDTATMKAVGNELYAEQLDAALDSAISAAREGK